MKIFQTYHMLPHIPQQSVRKKNFFGITWGFGLALLLSEALCQSQDVSEQQSVGVT